MNKQVNFETARLLKEKGFIPKRCGAYQTQEQNRLIDFLYNERDFTITSHLLAAPLIAEVVMWLYEQHDIWITVERHEPKALFNYVIVYQDEFTIKESRGKGYSSPTESYSEAINYSLKNLIK